ncbi:hypothetical protein ACW0JT_18150 [Arthrobacter sp. SA17]
MEPAKTAALDARIPGWRSGRTPGQKTLGSSVSEASTPGQIDPVKQDLQMHQVWPTSDGRAVLSPLEASEDFTQECWQANEVIATSPSDSFYSFCWQDKKSSECSSWIPPGPSMVTASHSSRCPRFSSTLWR